MVIASSAASEREIDIRDIITPLPSQERLLNAMYRREYILFGGAAGPGKSYILRWSQVELLLYWAARGITDVTTGLFCESYPALKDRHISKIEREFPVWLGRLTDSQARGFGFRLYERWGGGFVALRNLDDPAKYASTEFAAIGVDELTRNPRQTFDDLRFRKRWPGIEHSPFIAASNPGSIGHGWVKKLWLDRDFTGDDSRLDPDSFLFIPARAGENPHLPQSYWDTLNSLPADMRRAMLEGDWDVFAGQVFSEWRRDLHVVKPFAIPADWTRWVGIDYGYANPFCSLWFAEDPVGERLYIYREIYMTEVKATDQARRIRDLSKGERIKAYVADPSMWQRRRETTGNRIADEYASQGVILSQANNDRKARVEWVHEALAWKALPGTGRVLKHPYLQVFETCANLIRTLPALPYDPHDVEDVDTNAEDHAYDALGYGLSFGRDRRRSAKPRAVNDIAPGRRLVVNRRV